MMADGTLPGTRGRILDTALELFSEHGFDGTTLQQIADRLGFTKAALYYHFRSKDDLLHALLRPAMADLELLLDHHDGAPDTPSERRRFMRNYVDYLLCHRRLIGYMSRDLATLSHPAVALGSRERRARLESRLAGDGLDFNEQVRVTMAFRGIPGVIAQYPDAEAEHLRAALLDATSALLRGRLRAAPSRTPAGGPG